MNSEEPEQLTLFDWPPKPKKAKKDWPTIVDILYAVARTWGPNSPQYEYASKVIDHFIASGVAK